MTQEQKNAIWKIGKTHAELLATVDSLNKTISDTSVFSHDELSAMRQVRQILMLGLDRLAERMTITM